MDTTALPKNRADAKATGAKYYFTGEPCKHGHIAQRKTKGACVDCLKVEWAQARKTRAEYFQTYNKSDAGQKSKKVTTSAIEIPLLPKLLLGHQTKNQPLKNGTKTPIPTCTVSLLVCAAADSVTPRQNGCRRNNGWKFA